MNEVEVADSSLEPEDLAGAFQEAEAAAPRAAAQTHGAAEEQATETPKGGAKRNQGTRRRRGRTQKANGPRRAAQRTGDPKQQRQPEGHT